LLVLEIGHNIIQKFFSCVCGKWDTLAHGADTVMIDGLTKKITLSLKSNVEIIAHGHCNVNDPARRLDLLLGIDGKPVGIGRMEDSFKKDLFM